jgi:hypothetical protein
LTGLKKYNYDTPIHHCNPGFDLPVLCAGKAGKILIRLNQRV